MTESMHTILSGRVPAEPPEFSKIRYFIRDKLGEEVELRLQSTTIVIVAKNSAAAGAIHLHLHELSHAVQSTKKLLVRSR